MSLFAVDAQSKPSLFGGLSNEQQRTNTPFGAQQQPTATNQNSLFGNFSGNLTQQTNPLPIVAISGPSLGSSALGASLALSQPRVKPLWQPSEVAMSTREKTVPEQMQILLQKWSPDSSTCLFQKYFYNNVDANSVPFYGPAQGEDEQNWEEALTKKPGESSVPVLCKGFAALGNRLRIQVQSVVALQSRLHEINNSLVEMLQKHSGEMTVRTANAKRHHVALSQRCLRLATKVQILKNRGYALDGTEEELKQQLAGLEKGTFDPQLSSRHEEIWARMVGISERTKFLQDQAEKTETKLRDGVTDGLDDDILKTTKKILRDYDQQISHLHAELQQIRSDYDEWVGVAA